MPFSVRSICSEAGEKLFSTFCCQIRMTNVCGGSGRETKDYMWICLEHPMAGVSRSWLWLYGLVFSHDKGQKDRTLEKSMKSQTIQNWCLSNHDVLPRQRSRHPVLGWDLFWKRKTKPELSAIGGRGQLQYLTTTSFLGSVLFAMVTWKQFFSFSMAVW